MQTPYIFVLSINNYFCQYTSPDSQYVRYGEGVRGKGRDLAGFSSTDFNVSFKDGGVAVYEGQSGDGHDLRDCTEIEDGLVSEDREVY